MSRRKIYEEDILEFFEALSANPAAAVAKLPGRLQSRWSGCPSFTAGPHLEHPFDVAELQAYSAPVNAMGLICHCPTLSLPHLDLQGVRVPYFSAGWANL